MPDKSVLSPQNIGVAVLGGVAAAVIFAVVIRGGMGGLLFAHVAPLPLMIVALGFGVIHGATAALVATVILSIWPAPAVGMAHALMVALPAFAACYAVSGAPRAGRDLLTRNLPTWGALAPAFFLALAVILWIVVATISFGSFDEALSLVRGRIFLLIEELAKRGEMQEKVDATAASGAIARAIPAALATYALLIHVVNLWLAGRIAQASGLLTRPWPDIAQEFRLPRLVGGAFASGLLLTFFEGPSGAIGLTLAGTTGLLLGLQGLAVTHAYLRGSNSSALVLSVIYFTLGLLGWPMVFFTAIGAGDLVFDFRSRFAASAAKTAKKTD